MIRAAFAKINCTQPLGSRFGRLAVNILRADAVVWPLFARIALFDDGKTRAGIVILDQNFLTAPVVAELRNAMSKRTGIPPASFMVAATHTHNSPPTNPWLVDDPGFEFIDVLRGKFADLAEQALQSLQPVTLKAGRTEAPGWSFNRRPIYRTPDGREQVGTHGERSGDNFLRMEGPDESDLLVLVATGENGKVIGGMVNFACHPTTMYNDTAFSADYPGPLVETLEARYGGTFVFANGAAGNLSPKSSKPHRELAKAMGDALGQKAIEAIEHGERSPAGSIRVAQEILSIPQRRVTGKQVEVAQEYLQAAGKGTWTKSLPMELYGFGYHFDHGKAAVDDWLAREILGMWEWQRRAGTRELNEAVEIQTIVIGDIAFAALPGEPFSDFGHRLRTQSPFPHTFVIEMANGWHGYFPTQEGFKHGGYESSLAMQSRLVPTAGDLMTDTALSLLAKY